MGLRRKSGKFIGKLNPGIKSAIIEKKESKKTAARFGLEI